MESKVFCVNKFKELTLKDTVFFTARANKSINIIYTYLKLNKYETCLIQNEGGWMTYEPFANKKKFDVDYLKTTAGILDAESFELFLNNSDFNFDKTFLILNSLPGYSNVIDTEKIYSVCKKFGILLINDVSGSIGLDAAKFGDLILGSFGDAKPIDLGKGKGGFLSFSNYEKFYEFLIDGYVEFNCDFDALKSKLESLFIKLDLYYKARNLVCSKLDLLNLKHLSFTYFGINIIVPFSNDIEQTSILDLCSDLDLEYTLCPRYIRVMSDAVSIEIKRLSILELESFILR